MKTAICLSGELRSIDKCIDGWKEKILPKLGDYDLFYFAFIISGFILFILILKTS